MVEEVVLVDEANNVLGTMPKSEVHQRETPLHRAVSLFLFNTESKLLVQQRAGTKKTWPLVWSNSVCGHPGLHEENLATVARRLDFELGLKADWIEEAAPYRYRVSKDGVMENEICPIHIGVTSTEPRPNPDEVEAVRWLTWDEFLTAIREQPEDWSPWCIEEAALLEKTPRFRELLSR